MSTGSRGGLATVGERAWSEGKGNGDEKGFREEKVDPGAMYVEDYEDENVDKYDVWDVIHEYFDKNGLCRQAIDSFDLFVDETMLHVINDSRERVFTPEPNVMRGGNSAKRVQHTIKFTSINMQESPTIKEKDGKERMIWPNQARQRNVTYASTLFADVKYSFVELDDKTGDPIEETRQDEIIKLIEIGRIPIMLRSDSCRLKGKSNRALYDAGECEYDPGGYFIIRGNEKVLVAQETMASNHVYIFKGKEKRAEIKSKDMRTSQPGISLTVRLIPAPKGSNVRGEILMAEVPLINESRGVPLVVLFRALGCQSDLSIMKRIVYDMGDEQMIAMLRPSFEYARAYDTREAALYWMGTRALAAGTSMDKCIEYARNVILQLKLFPHISTEPNASSNSESDKAYFLGYMVNRLLSTMLQRRAFDDRDHYANKRISLAGPLLGRLFRQKFAQLCETVKKKLEGVVDNVYDDRQRFKKEVRRAIDKDIITNGLTYALATGNWCVDNAGQPAKTGVAQVLDRLSYVSMLSQLRRLRSPVDSGSKLTEPRKLHNTQWGMICPCETPEGQQCGIVKNLTLMSYVTTGQSNIQVLEEELEKGGVMLPDSVEFVDIPNMTKVFLNGNWMGVHKNAMKLVRRFRKIRRKGKLKDVSIAWDIRDRELRIFTDEGRVCRPLFIVNDDNELEIKKTHIRKIQQGRMVWNDLINHGLIEYIDTEEEEATTIAMQISDLDDEANKFTHAEIHPCMILGVCATVIPFPDHNQSPRNVYQSAMGKQAMSLYITSFQERMDTNSHVLQYPQKPMVCTKGSHYLNYNRLPAGQNVIVGIMVYTGYNQEDSLIFNQSSIERGLFRSCKYRCYSANNDGKKNVELEFERPELEDTDGMKIGVNYDKLDNDGLIEPAVQVLGNDVIVGRTMPIAQHGMVCFALFVYFFYLGRKYAFVLLGFSEHHTHTHTHVSSSRQRFG